LINGIINIYKEKGYTSHDVVAKMRGILKIKKIGHTGTLDPDAIGVLPVCIGKGTKLVDLITDKDKTYEAVLKLGITTDTQDVTGVTLTTSEVTVNFEQISAVINSYIGEYDQLPPMFSALKVNGKRLYELARQGQVIERERRRVVIKDIRILAFDEEEHEVTMSVDCSKGTYIRTLLHDIGNDLGCGGTMKSLIRTAVGNFRLEDALKLSEIETLVKEEHIDEHVIEVDAFFQNYQKIIVQHDYNKLIYNGNSFTIENILSPESEVSVDRVRVYDEDNNFIGIYCYEQDNKLFKPVKMFLS